MNTLSPPVLVFDVNETLLDLTTLEPLFERCFGAADVLREWFPELVLYSQTLTLAETYVSFAELGAAVLRMVGENHGVRVSDDDIAELRERLSGMPACSDVPPALARLKTAGFRLVTLTNSAPSASPTPLEKAGIADLFEQHFSVDPLRRFKPHPAVYRQVADALHCELHQLCLVACHIWDVIGAQALGCRGAFIQRPHNSALYLPELPAPDYTAPDLGVLADQLIG